MEIFPTQYSLLSASALNDKIQELYGFKNTFCKLLIHNVSDTYLIENESSKYILKIYRNTHRTIGEIKEEVDLLNLLKNENAKVAYPVSDLQGNYIQTFGAAEGDRNAVLFSFAQGRVVYDLTEQQLLIIGKGMADIHNITSGIQLAHHRQAYDIDTTLTRPLTIIKPAFKDLPDEYEYLTTTVALAATKIRQFKTDQFSYGYCHYDFFPKNFHFTESDEITFFDFDFAGTGLLANDIASFYMHFFLEVHFNKITQQQADELFAVFVSGYRSVRPLSEDELKAIPYLGFAFWVFYLGFQYENFEDWSNFFFNTRYIKDRVALIKKWADWYCEF